MAEASWGSPGDGQYHIQTDEGPERYFRFQTDNGQFRKERRLKDGTVIGKNFSQSLSILVCNSLTEIHRISPYSQREMISGMFLCGKIL